MTEPRHRTARGAGSSEPDRVAGSHPPRSSGCRARHPCGLIAPGYATCRRSRFRVKTPQVRPSCLRLPQPIRRLLLLAHPSGLELPVGDLLPHQGQAKSLALRAAPGTTDEHVDVGHAPPSLPRDPDWCYKIPGGTEGRDSDERRSPTSTSGQQRYNAVACSRTSWAVVVEAVRVAAATAPVWFGLGGRYLCFRRRRLIFARIFASVAPRSAQSTVPELLDANAARHRTRPERHWAGHLRR